MLQKHLGCRRLRTEGCDSPGHQKWSDL